MRTGENAARLPASDFIAKIACGRLLLHDVQHEAGALWILALSDLVLTSEEALFWLGVHVDIAVWTVSGTEAKSVTETLLAAMRDRQSPVGNRQRVTMKTSGPAAKEIGGTDLLSLTFVAQQN